MGKKLFYKSNIFPEMYQGDDKGETNIIALVNIWGNVTGEGKFYGVSVCTAVWISSVEVLW